MSMSELPYASSTTPELAARASARCGPAPWHGEAGPTATLELAEESPGLANLWLRVLEPAASQVAGAQRVERAIPLAPGAGLVLGSGVEADVRLTDPTVSQRHCRVTHTGRTIEVTDLGSKNGVRVGGARVPAAGLGAGSSFEIGRTRVRLDALAEAPCEDVAPLPGLVGGSRPMRHLAASVRRVARLRLPVLLRGESGTGKDLVARAVHDESPRRAGPFVVLNAAAISRELAESELFGHRRGAFTGAVRDRKGAFREAHGGTLFLDEIAALPLDLQAKLLRAVEEGAVRPVGAEAPVEVDVRLVAATCEPLEQMVAERGFRGDLYERLAVCVLHVPTLRDRPEDVAPLAKHLLRASELGARELGRGAVAALRAHRWPGNVRELRNVVVQAALRSGARIEARDVEAVLAERASVPRRRLTPGDALRVFEDAGRNVSAAARRAELPRSTMRDLLRAAGVPPTGREG
jgi:transcriptional regulator with AAA-type ATPase domain